MSIRRILLVVMSLAVSGYVMPAAWADGDRGSVSDTRDYAQREAQSKDAAEFVGGSHGVVIAIIIIAAIVIVLYFILDSGGHHGKKPAEATDVKNASTVPQPQPAGR